MNTPRVWWIQKPKAHNCPVGQSGPLDGQGAVFQTFEPTQHLPNCEWVRVVEYCIFEKLVETLREYSWSSENLASRVLAEYGFRDSEEKDTK